MREPETLDRVPLVAVSIAFHLLLFWFAGRIPDPPEPPRLYDFDVAEAVPDPPPKKAEPPPKPPEPEPKEEPPETKEEPPEPEPKVKPRPKPVDRKPPPPPDAAPPPKFRLPGDRLVQPGEGLGASVDQGESSPGGYDPRGEDKGKPGGKPGGKGDGPADSKGPAQSGPPAKPWKPTSELYIQRLPGVVKRPPKLQCPATRDGVAGIVVLKVQIRRDGSMRGVNVAKGIDKTCDQIAVKALKQAKFKAAVATDGNPADYELRYEYEFRAAD